VEVEIRAAQVVFFATSSGVRVLSPAPRTRPPSHGCVIVVAASVGDSGAAVIMRKETMDPADQSRTQIVKDSCPQTELLPQFFHRRSNHAEGFRHDR